MSPGPTSKVIFIGYWSWTRQLPAGSQCHSSALPVNKAMGRGATGGFCVAWLLAVVWGTSTMRENRHTNAIDDTDARLIDVDNHPVSWAIARLQMTGHGLRNLVLI